MQLLVRLLIGGVLFAYLFYFGLLDLHRVGKLGDEPLALGGAVLLLFATLPIAALRWQILLRSQGITLPFLKTLQIILSSQFFNTVLPGGAGGDLVRGMYLWNALPSGRTLGLLSIVADRIVGVSGLVSLGAAAIILHPSELGTAITVATGILALGVAGGVVTGALYSRRIAGILRRRGSRLGARLGSIVEEVGQALRLYRRFWRHVLACWALSLVLFAFAAAGLLIIADVLQIGNLSNLDYVVAWVWSLIANAVPVTPGGIGIGESAFASLSLALEKVPSGAPYATVFLAYRGVLVIATLPGLIAYLTYRRDVVTHGR